MHHAHRSVSAAASLLVVAVGAAHADVTFSDSTFNNADWTVHTLNILTGGTSVGTQTPGGNPGTGRSVTNTLNLFGTIFSLHAYGTAPGTSYDPSISGAVGSVDFTIDAQWLAGIGGEGEGIALGAMQGAALYYADYDITGSTGSWNTFTSAANLAPDFIPFNGGPAMDFSASGAPIRFGFVVGNYAPDQAYFNTVIFDNFAVTIHSVPAPGAAGALLGLTGFAITRRRRA